MSVYMQFAPYNLKTGDWMQQRDSLRDTVINTLAEYAPDFPSKILAVQTLTPFDLEGIYGAYWRPSVSWRTGARPDFHDTRILGWARYATPVKGLYLCGNGTHPGNGVTGASGHNAAREILKHLRSVSSNSALVSNVRSALTTTAFVQTTTPRRFQCEGTC